MDNQQNFSSQQQNQPVESSKKSSFLKSLLLLLASIVVLCLGIFAYLYFSTDINNDGSNAFGIAEFKCKMHDMVFEEGSWGAHCYKKAADSGEECIQNSDCDGGACRPSATLDLLYPRAGHDKWDGTPLENDEGYLVGHCSEADYTDNLNQWSITQQPIGCSLVSPMKLDSDTSGISCLVE